MLKIDEKISRQIDEKINRQIDEKLIDRWVYR